MCQGRRFSKLVRLVIVFAAVAVGATAGADPPAAEIRLISPGCAKAAGQALSVEIALFDAPEEVVGGQFFLTYDEQFLLPVAVVPGDPPFSREVYEDLSVPGQIDYASGVFGDGPGAQSGSMARIIFLVLSEQCAVEDLVRFRPHEPTTRVSNRYAEEVPSTHFDMGPADLDFAPPLLTCESEFVFSCSSEADPGPPDFFENCSDVVLESADTVLPGLCAQERTIVRTWTATDGCGNSSSCTQMIRFVDDDPPTLFCADIVVPADAGGCDASAATVDPMPPPAGDLCDPAPVVEFVSRSDARLLDDPYPVGTTIIRWSATDDCGNVATCDQVVTVRQVNELDVIVELQSGVDPGPFVRCITFELACGDGAVVADVELTFIDGLGQGVVEVPCGAYTCITARDRLHTLSRTDGDDFGIASGRYVAEFTGDGPDGDALLGGNLNDDPYIDILDFGVFASQFGSDLGGGGTDCEDDAPHADVSGDGLVTTGDYTFIQFNFLRFSETGCCAGAESHAAREGPIVRIEVPELHRRGLGDLAVADLNRDGWLDPLDIAAFVAGADPVATPDPRR
ncbi:MAG: hypothetical protein ACYTJ0_09605 [Planctomycetota bacterium]|jgi:hypothetical protein